MKVECMKNSLFFLMVFIGLLLFLAGCDTNGYNDNVKKYVKDKYGFDVNLIDSPTTNEANLGDVNVTVERKDMPSFTFQVFLEGSFFKVNIAGDSYQESYDFYQFKQKYMPAFEQQLKVLGFDNSNLQRITQSEGRDHTEKAAELYLFKPRGLTANEQDFQMTAAALPVMKDIEQQLKQAGYRLDTVIINDNAYAKYKNVFDYSKAGAISKQIELSEIDKMNNADEVKRYLFNDYDDSKKLIGVYYFKKDSGKIESIRKKLKQLGMDVLYEDSYLSCEDSTNDFNYQSIDTNKCKSYAVALEINKPIKKLNNESDINKIAKAENIIVESTQLPVHNITIYTTDEHPITYISLKDLNFISDQAELKDIIKKEIEQR